jgi:HNH endonuclease
MRASERESLRLLYQFRCGYCGVRETDVGSELTIDHFHPLSRDGIDELGNWVYWCHACNEFKGDYWNPGSARRILHPLRDPIASHVVERPDGTLEPLTETGVFHIQRLRLNRVSLIENRRERRLTADILKLQARLLEFFVELDARVAKVIYDLKSLRSGRADQ